MKTAVRLCLLPGLFLAALAAPADQAWPLPSTPPAAAGFASERLDVLHRNLRQVVDAGQYSGYVALITRDGKILDWRAHGWQDVAARTPMQKDSIVRIFSMSKLITSAAALMLMEDGRLKLSDPVEKYLPALKGRKVLSGGTAEAPVLVAAARPITIRDLLTHTAGYFYDASWSSDSPLAIELFQRAKVWEAPSTEEFVNRVALIPLHEQPGTRFRYGINTDLLGAIVEQVSGQGLDVFLQERIFGPLRMRDSGFRVPAEKRARLATIYHRELPDKPGGKEPAANRSERVMIRRAGASSAQSTLERDADFNLPEPPPRGFVSGGGGLYSTAADYVRFAQMLLNGGRLDDAPILGRKTVELMTQNHIGRLADPHPFGFRSHGFGLGVRVVTDLGESPALGSYGCFGWDGAATTTVQIDPKEKTVAILLCQHIPYNEDDIFGLFTNGYYSAMGN